MKNKHEYWKHFFGSSPYPFDLALVEARDNTKEQVDFLSNIFREMKHSQLMDAGCGFGRHADGLTRIGFVVVAVDLLSNNCMEAAKRNNAIMVIRSDLCDLPFPDASFPGIYSMYSSLGYDPRRDRRVFKEFARVQPLGGLLCIDIANWRATRRRLQIGLEQFQSGFSIFARLINKRTFDVHYRAVSFSRRIQVHRLYYRIYKEEYLSSELAKYGYLLTQHYGDYNRSPYGVSSTRSIQIYEKRSNGEC